jgi:hypothetical protein
MECDKMKRLGPERRLKLSVFGRMVLLLLQPAFMLGGSIIVFYLLMMKALQHPPVSDRFNMMDIAIGGMVLITATFYKSIQAGRSLQRLLQPTAQGPALLRAEYPHERLSGRSRTTRTCRHPPVHLYHHRG